MHTKVLCCASCRQDGNLHVNEKVSWSRFKCRQENNVQQTRANWRNTQKSLIRLSQQTDVSVPSARTATTLLHLHTKKGSCGSCNSLRSLKQDWTLWTGSFLWRMMRVQTPHSFCAASWMLDLPILQVPIWITTYLFVLVLLCETVFVFKNDYWATFFFVWDKFTPHTLHIL